MPRLKTPALGKQLLAAAPSRTWIEKVVTHRKIGFNVPIGMWLNRKTNSVTGPASRARSQQVLEAFTGRGTRPGARQAAAVP